MSASFPVTIKLKDVIKILQNHDKGFNLYQHKEISHKWLLSYKKDGKLLRSYPLTAPKGNNTLIDRSRLKAIARHFSVPSAVFYSDKKVKK